SRRHPPPARRGPPPGAGAALPASRRPHRPRASRGSSRRGPSPLRATSARGRGRCRGRRCRAPPPAPAGRPARAPRRRPRRTPGWTPCWPAAPTSRRGGPRSRRRRERARARPSACRRTGTIPRADARVASAPVKLADVPTPALVVDRRALDHNIATMSDALPGPRLRPHVKAFKSTALARELADAGHRTFCCATIREVEGMAAAGLGEDLLLANEVLDCTRLGRIVDAGVARVTVAVDSPETVDAAAAGGVREVVVDVDVGLPRCGCDPADAGPLADRARDRGLVVRGVMGYEGHLMRAPADEKAGAVATAMERLLAAHVDVGGDVVSAGGTGTWDTNRWATELQAGS